MSGLIFILIFIACVSALLIVLDWILGKVKKDWKPLPWETFEDNK